MGSKLEAKDDAAFVKTTMKTWRALNQLGDYMESEVAGVGTVKEIRVQGPAATGEGYRAIVKVIADDGGAFIAFHNASSLSELMVTLNERMDNATMKWKDDMPYDQRVTIRKGNAG